jgi:hypothetical protein
MVANSFRFFANLFASTLWRQSLLHSAFRARLRSSRIGIQPHFLDTHSEPFEFSLDTNLMDVPGSARHGDNANAHGYRALERHEERAWTALGEPGRGS